MNNKFKMNRRALLAQMSKGLGLYSAANLFNQISFAQNATKIERVIHIFFYHGVLSRNKGEKSNFYVANDTPMDALLPYSDRCRFIRHIDYAFKKVPGDSVGNKTKNAHCLGQSSAFTGCAAQAGHGKTDSLGDKDTGVYGGTSIDILAGQYLQKKYSTEVPFLLMGNSNQQTNNNSGSPFQWLTSSWEKNRKPRLPYMDITQVQKLMEGYKNNGLSCAGANPGVDLETAKDNLRSEVSQLKYLAENLKSFRSEYLMPGEEMEKLEKQLSRKIAQQESFLNTGAGSAQAIEDCGNVPSIPGKMNKAMGAGAEYANGKTRDFGYNERSDKIFDLMMFAFKSNYTRSVTYYPGDFYKKAHSAGHSKDHGVHSGYQKHLFDSVARLMDKLKANNMLDSTLIVTAGEFGNHIFDHHEGQNAPWMVINGGRSGEYSNGKVHPGDVHCSTMQKIGDTSAVSFGCKRHITNRAGKYTPDLC